MALKIPLPATLFCPAFAKPFVMCCTFVGNEMNIIY